MSTQMTPIAGELIPIDQVARRFGLRASAIRYYEERGLLDPVSRRGGRRCYGPAEVRRLAIIQYWQTSGLMSLDEIGEILSGPDATTGWNAIVQGRIDSLRLQAEQIMQACEFLEHLLEHHQDSPPDGCEHYETLILALPAGALPAGALPAGALPAGALPAGAPRVSGPRS